MEQPKPMEPSRAIDGLVTGFYRPLLAYFVRNAGNSCDAQDMVQDVFVRLLKYNCVPVSSPAALVFTVASNVLKDWRQRSRYVNGRSEQITGDFLVDELSPARIIDARQSLRCIIDALDQLGERTRSIFILFRIEKMRQRDIADRFGISVSAVEKHIAKASAHLAQSLDRRE